MKHANRISRVVLVSLLVFAYFAPAALALSIDPTDKYAWGENIGWLNWGTPEGNVDVPQTTGDLTGYVWGENIGWISLNCSNTASCGTVAYAVSRASGELSGYGWGENVGWISFSCVNTGSCGVVDYRVFVDDTTGIFSGWAWGENIGWISTNCSNTGSCGTVDYKVRTVTPPTPTPGGGGGGFTSTPTPGGTPGPNITIRKVPSSSAVQAGGTITYDVTVENMGNGAATGVIISDTIDDDTTLVWVVPTPDTNTGRTFSFNIGTLAPGAVFSYQAQVRVRSDAPPGTVIGNTVYVTSNNFTTVAAVSAAIVAGPAPSATPTPTPAGTPTPTATPAPSPSPLPSPFPTPPAPPPPVMPPSPPPSPPSTPPGPFVGVIRGIADFLDGLAQRIFGFLGETCEGALGITSCSVTALAVGAVILGLIAALIQHELAAAMFSLFQFIGIKKKARVWGVVYDSATKRPIPAAKLELVDATGRVLEVRYGDREGRYGFLTTPASLNQPELQVSIRVVKPGYRFPSSLAVGGTDYVVYENPYRGGVFNIVGSGIVNYSIPLDPIEPGRVRLSGWGAGLFGALSQRLLSLAFIIGLVAVPLNYYFAPTTQNLVILIVFFAVNALRMVVMYRPYGVTIDALTGKKLQYALVTLLDEQGTRVGFAVSDEHGRYVLSAERNREYDVVAYTSANIIPQRTSREHISKLSHVGRTAWVTRTLRV